MKKLAFLFLFPALAVFGQKVPVKEHFLSNGMKVLLVERHDAPSIAGGWVARVGSANERPGITGIAHLFEHMMFKGTSTIGFPQRPSNSRNVQITTIAESKSKVVHINVWYFVMKYSFPIVLSETVHDYA